MTALSYSQGHQIEWIKNNWIYKDTKQPIAKNRSCKKCGKYPVIMKINKEKCEIDYCIAPIIKVLNDIGIETTFCCCGHGRKFGHIQTKEDLKWQEKKQKNFPFVFTPLERHEGLKFQKKREEEIEEIKKEEEK